MTSIAAPVSAPVRRFPWTVIVIAAAAALLGLASWGVIRSMRGGNSAALEGRKFFTVMPMDLEVKILKDGELQAINNIDITCRVEGSNTIQQMVKEGASVKKGDVLVLLDSSQIKLKIEDTTLDLQKAEADLLTAREIKEIQESQNAANLEAAQVASTLAKLDLQQYVEGTYPQQKSNAETDLAMAQLSLKNAQEDLAQTNKLFGKGFVTAADVKKSELTVTTASNNLDKCRTALEVLTKYQYASDLATKKNAVAQADQKLYRTKRENASNLAQKSTDVTAKTQALELLKRRMARYKEQFDNCTIEAPADGMVVYASSNDRNSSSQIQEGAQVRERQLLLRLPDTSAMKAVVRVQESQVPKLQLGQRALVRIVGVARPISATLSRISVLADSASRWWNPDLKEYPVDLDLDVTPADLKPGMRADAEIFISRHENALAVPMGAVYAVGSRRFVFVREGEGAKAREVHVGAVTDTHAQLLDGVKQGDELLLLLSGEGRELLEKQGINVAPEPTTRPGGGRRRRPA